MSTKVHSPTKILTLIEGFGAKDAEETVAELKRRLQCNGSIVEKDGKFTIQLSGNKTSGCCAYFVSKYQRM